MNHSFNTNAAKLLGVEEAVFLKNVEYWVDKNAANDINFREGHYWTYNSVEALLILFPYWNESKIRRMVKKLHEGGYLLKGDYSEDRFRRKIWYSLTQKYYDFLEEKRTVPKRSPRVGHNEQHKSSAERTPRVGHNAQHSYTNIKHTDINQEENTSASALSSSNYKFLTNIFLLEFEKIHKEPFEGFDDKTQQSGMHDLILKIFRSLGHKGGEWNVEQAGQKLKEIINGGDEWTMARLSPKILNKNFSEIVLNIKNGKNGKKEKKGSRAIPGKWDHFKTGTK